MMTPTHLLVGLAIFARPGERMRNLAAVAGALLPDAAIFVLFGWAKASGVPEAQIWRVLYWQEPWQTAVAVGNSVPIWLGLLAVGLWRRVTWVWVISGAALLHLALDIPFHADDAHQHFWPLTDWRFFSPLSYWDSAHYAGYVQVVETLLALSLLIVLVRRFDHAGWRTALGITAFAYLAGPIYFMIML